MTKAQLEKKLVALERKAKRLSKEYGGIRYKTAIPWKPKKELFERANLTYDPFGCVGYSYGWYQIVKRVGWTHVLNTYRYSATTGKHVGLLAQLMRQLGIKVVEIEAPRGLQNLDAAMDHHCHQYAKEAIRLKYVRKPQHDCLKFHVDATAWLARIGVKRPDMAWYFMNAEQDRHLKNMSQREKRTRAKRAVKQMQGLTVVMNAEEVRRAKELAET